MDKPLLLQQLALVRGRAEAAHLETVIQNRRITGLERRGRNTTKAKAELNATRMAEQKHLREMDWILDQLDHAYLYVPERFSLVDVISSTKGETHGLESC